jgi:hypothetical protein
MTPNDLVSKLCELGPQDLCVILHVIAENWYDARLESGEPLSDATAAKAYLEKCSEAAIVRDFPFEMEPIPQLSSKVVQFPPKQTFICPDCDHEHIGREECWFYLGEEKFCRCPSKVRA